MINPILLEGKARSYHLTSLILKIAEDIGPARKPVQHKYQSKFDFIRKMKKIELTEWFKKNRSFYDYADNGDRSNKTMDMVSKLQYANLRLKGYIK